MVFAGSDEVAEIAYMTLQETTLELVAVVDPDTNGSLFFGKQIKPMDALRDVSYDTIIVASYLNREKIYQALLSQGAKKKDIRMIF